MYHYSNPKRENDPYALPDVEVFYVSMDEIISSDKDSIWYDYYTLALEESQGTEDPQNNAAKDLQGFYYWYCFPGCLPDSDPIGPFETESSALTHAQMDAMQWDNES